MKDLEEIDEHTWELLEQAAATLNMNVQVVAERFEKLMQAAREAVEVVAERLIDLELPYFPRTPAEIKKNIKYEKNPMRLKQLNKELNASYKFYKRK